jgi:predicted transcriptional regulator
MLWIVTVAAALGLVMAGGCGGRNTASADHAPPARTLDRDGPEQCFVIEGVEPEWVGYAGLVVGDATFRRDLMGSEDLDDNQTAEWIEAGHVSFLVEPLGGSLMILRVQTPTSDPAAWTLGQVAADLLIREVAAKRSSHLRRLIVPLSAQRTELAAELDSVRDFIENQTRGAPIADLEGSSASEHLANLDEQRLQLAHQYDVLAGEFAAAEALQHQPSHTYVPAVAAAAREDPTLRVLKEELGELIAESITADQDSQRQRAGRRIDELTREIDRREAAVVDQAIEDYVNVLTARLVQLEQILNEQAEDIALAKETVRLQRLTQAALRTHRDREGRLSQHIAEIDRQIAALQLRLETDPQVVTALRNHPLP